MTLDPDQLMALGGVLSCCPAHVRAPFRGEDGHMLTLASVKRSSHPRARCRVSALTLANQSENTFNDGDCTENRAAYTVLDHDLLINNVLFKESMFLLS